MSSISLLLVGGLTAFGVTYATSYYQKPAESYSFDGDAQNIQVFQIKHYFHSGTGADSSHPYEISNPIELRNLSKLQSLGYIADGTYFKLVNSFTWSGADLIPIGDTSHAWKGHFDGNGKVIHGLSIDATGLTNSGMFGYVNGGTVENFILSAPTLTTTVASYAGFAVGNLNAGTCTKIGIYGGTSNLKCRATLVLGGKANGGGNTIVGKEGDGSTSTCQNYLTSVAGATLTAATSKVYTNSGNDITAETYNLWLNGASVANSN